MKNNKISVGLDNHFVEVGYNKLSVLPLIEFVCSDLHVDSDGIPKTRLDVVSSGKQSMLSLWEGDKRIYFGNSRFSLAYNLINQIIYHVVKDVDNQHAIHAGAVRRNGCGIILPGTTGKGKSTFTGWLSTRGFQYLTDELVLLSGKGTITPLTRPLSLKSDPSRFFSPYLKQYQDEVIAEENGIMIPYRLLNPDICSVQSEVTHIIFPAYKRDAQLELHELSPAKCCHMLLESHVNSRNLANLGIASLAKIVKRCRSYRLIHAGFTGVWRIIDSIVETDRS